MNTFLRAVERRVLSDHEARITSMRGDELPKQPRCKDGSGHTERVALKKQEMEARRRAVRRMLEEGSDFVTIARELRISERQVRWVVSP